MATHTAAARRSHERRHAAAPRHARRISGPIARPALGMHPADPAGPAVHPDQHQNDADDQPDPAADCQTRGVHRCSSPWIRGTAVL